jgi:hypothetical protein
MIHITLGIILAWVAIRAFYWLCNMPARRLKRDIAKWDRAYAVEVQRRANLQARRRA